MDDSVGNTIEKIKLQEQEIEIKLKEKREHEAALSALHRGIKDAVLQAAKSDQERLKISESIKKLRPLLESEKIKRGALCAQLETHTKMLEDLRAQSDRRIAEVWSQRSSLCDKVHSVSDVCDIWALLMRPLCAEHLPQIKSQVKSVGKNSSSSYKPNNAKLIDNEARLKTALQRRKDVEATREKLLSEPDTGEEFIRIKNALRYCLQKIADLQKKNDI